MHPQPSIVMLLLRVFCCCFFVVVFFCFAAAAAASASWCGSVMFLPQSVDGCVRMLASELVVCYYFVEGEREFVTPPPLPSSSKFVCLQYTKISVYQIFFYGKVLTNSHQQ